MPSAAHETDDSSTPERPAEATTSEEAMDDSTSERGFSDESAYTPTESGEPDGSGTDRRTTMAGMNEASPQTDAAERTPAERQDDSTVLGEMND